MMFLAINEIKYAKYRYVLVTGMIFLISYLVFFLTGLAFGLAQDNRTAVDKWDADSIILMKDANNNLGMSMIDYEVLDQITAEDKAVVSQLPGVVSKKGTEASLNAIFFGIDQDQFLMPDVSEGRIFAEDKEVVADRSLQDEYDVQIGDQLKISGNETVVTVVGFTEKAKFNVSPVLYTSLETYQELRYGDKGAGQPAKVNGIVTRGKVSDLPKNVVNIEIGTFIQKLPGYSAQVLTFGFMIGFLILIASIVVGIFMYVLTMQKTDLFGVMKAQGISSRYIGTSVVIQTFLLTTTGVVTGLLGTVGTAYVLPSKVPFESNLLFYGGISLLMVAFASLGALFSVKAIVKIDPLKAIG